MRWALLQATTIDLTGLGVSAVLLASLTKTRSEADLDQNNDEILRGEIFSYFPSRRSMSLVPGDIQALIRPYSGSRNQAPGLPTPIWRHRLPQQLLFSDPSVVGLDQYYVLSVRPFSKGRLENLGLLRQNADLDCGHLIRS